MWFRSACVALVISVMELRAGARGWVVAGTLGIGASMASAGRGEPTESAVDMWATVRGAALGGLEGEHKSITGFVTNVASVLEAAFGGVEDRHKSMTGCAPCVPVASDGVA